VVHAFRTVVGDFGANWGFIISSAGFLSGAYEAARNTNVRLVDWDEFQELFVDRWIKIYMMDQLQQEADPLVDYAEPINTRVFRKADSLSPEAQQRFGELRDRHADIAFFALHQYLHYPDRAKRLELPLKQAAGGNLGSYPASRRVRGVVLQGTSRHSAPAP
jgi:hypothetical protein